MLFWEPGTTETAGKNQFAAFKKPLKQLEKARFEPIKPVFILGRRQGCFPWRPKILQGGRSCSLCRFFPVGRVEPGTFFGNVSSFWLFSWSKCGFEGLGPLKQLEKARLEPSRSRKKLKTEAEKNWRLKGIQARGGLWKFSISNTKRNLARGGLWNFLLLKTKSKACPWRVSGGWV